MKKIGKTISLFATILIGAFTLQSDIVEARQQKNQDPYGEAEAAWTNYLSSGTPLSPFLNVGSFGQYTEDENGTILLEDLYPSLMNKNKIPSEDYLKIQSIITEGYSKAIGSIDGFQNFKNLEDLTVDSLPLADFRSLRNLIKVKHIQVSGENNISLDDFKTWTQLEEFHYVQTYNQNKAALTDISALSSNPNLKRIEVRSYGSLPTITLSKHHAQYELFDPIVLSSQFGENKINYSITGYTEKESVTEEEYNEYYDQIDDEDSAVKEYSDTVSEDGLLRFENIPPFAESLNFQAKINCGSYSYEADIKIPIRWVA